MIVPGPIDNGIVAAVLAVLGILLVTAGVVLLQAERAFSRRLRAFISDFAGEDDGGDQVVRRRENPSPIYRINTLLTRGQISAGVRRELIRAGSPLRPGQFIYLRMISTVLGGIILYALATQAPLLFQPLLFLIGLFAGWMLPRSILRYMQARRLAAFELYLPDAIDIMAGSLEAGSSLQMALDLVAREIPAPVSTEFGRSLREVSLGMALDDALLNMLDRVYSEDLDMMATAVAIQYRVGGNLAEVLKVIAHTIRERVRIRADIRTLTAQQSISANVLIMLPIALAILMFIINPAYERRLFDPGFPQFATVGAVVMIILAYFLLKRIVKIDA